MQLPLYAETLSVQDTEQLRELDLQPIWESACMLGSS